MKTIVGSGWWSSLSRAEWSIGDDFIRSPDFFSLWHRQVILCLDPALIVVTDSHSPQKPEWSRYERIRWIELDENYGHAMQLRGSLLHRKFCGHTRSVLLGAMYAHCCDADRYVYVEQDCLLRGTDFLKKAIDNQTHDIYLGDRVKGGISPGGGIAANNYQNSVLVMTRAGIERFIQKIFSAPESDGQMSIERKIERDLPPFGILSVPFGRSRPIDFTISHFYAQHMTLDEINSFCLAEGIDASDFR